MCLTCRTAATRFTAPTKPLLLGLLGLFCAAAPFPGNAQSVADSPHPITPAAIQELADRQFDGAQQAGGSAVVTVVKDGQIIFMKGYGLANPKTGAPVDPESTLYRIGSVSKLFTAITALQLVDRGVIDPNADVNIYLAKAGVRIHDRFSEPVTMKDLLSLRAGRFDWTYSYYYPVHDDDNSREPADEISRRLWRTAKPGDVAAYDNNGVGLIGFIAESASGVPFRQLVRTSILDPLGMTRSVAGVPRNRVPDMPGCSDSDPATAYRSCPYDLITENLRPSGGMTATAADMGKFMLALLSKGQAANFSLLAPATWNRFVDFGPDKLDPRLPTWGQIIYETYRGNRHAYGHDGGVGQFSTQLRLYPESNIGVFVCVQRGLDWQHPPHFPKSLSELFQNSPPESAAQRALLQAQKDFELQFVQTFIPAWHPQPGHLDVAANEIPTNNIEGRYWTQLAKGTRYLLMRLLERFEAATVVSADGPDVIRVAGPGPDNKPQEYRRSGRNSFQQVGGERTLVFAAFGNEVNANFTDASSLDYLRRMPWHYRPWITIYPILIALALLLTAPILRIARNKDPADRLLIAAATVGAILVTLGLWAELQFAMTELYHGGHTLLAACWRLMLHIGLIVLAFAIAFTGWRWKELTSSAQRTILPIKAGYVGLLSASALLVIVLIGYWGLIGVFTN